MPILLPRFICIRSNISSQISSRKIKFLGSYWKSHLCVSDSQSIIFRYQGWDKQKHWIQTERWNLGCQVINYASINQSINALGGQASHWVGLSRAVPHIQKKTSLFVSIFQICGNYLIVINQSTWTVSIWDNQLFIIWTLSLPLQHFYFLKFSPPQICWSKIFKLYKCERILWFCQTGKSPFL